MRIFAAFMINNCDEGWRACQQCKKAATTLSLRLFGDWLSLVRVLRQETREFVIDALSFRNPRFQV